jgi:hypothetical protein
MTTNLRQAFMVAILGSVVGCSHSFDEPPESSDASTPEPRPSAPIDSKSPSLPIDASVSADLSPESDANRASDGVGGAADAGSPDTSPGGAGARCPAGCQCDIGFEDGIAAGWSQMEIDGEVSDPTISSDLAHSGTRSLVVSLSDSTRFGHFRLLVEICPGSTFDLGDRLFSFWVKFEGLPDAPPDPYSGCEGGIVTPDGTGIGVSNRVLWPADRWYQVRSTRAWPIVRRLSIYCVVGSPLGGGRIHIDDLRIE